jgi:hypothetical protein
MYSDKVLYELNIQDGLHYHLKQAKNLWLCTSYKKSIKTALFSPHGKQYSTPEDNLNPQVPFEPLRNQAVPGSQLGPILALFTVLHFGTKDERASLLEVFVGQLGFLNNV